MSAKPNEHKGFGNQRDQSGNNLRACAEGGAIGSQPMAAPTPMFEPNAKADAARSVEALRRTPPGYTCKVRVKVALFFDGTGNNMDADVPTKEHSNVARLFRSHVLEDPKTATYKAYVPGLGTYFKDIGDPGDDEGMAFGKRGEPRLVWAMQQIDKAVANHPQANITGLDLALFGFSRGAALARAFALRIQQRCKAHGAGWAWDKGGFEARLYFMGLFDTVASVGLPASSGLQSARIAKKWVSLDAGLRERRHNTDNGLYPISDSINLGIAFGKEPGADPTPGMFNGHAAWADDLRIPPMALQCVHYVSGHEARNSFPLDSARVGNTYPACVDERSYPGVHSDVGGGYRPGEGGRSILPKDALSLPALHAMHTAAQQAGVPLNAKDFIQSGDDFEVSPALLARFNVYVQLADAHSGNKSLEARALGNMKLLYAWRFKRIHERNGGARPDAATIEREEQRYQAEGVKLDKDIAAAAADPSRVATEKALNSAQAERDNASASYYALARSDWGDPQRMQATLGRMRQSEAALAQAKENFASADDARMKLAARKATLGGSGLVGNLNVYDKNLLLDVEAIERLRAAYPKARLRPHYANLIAAFEAEYVSKRGLLEGQTDVLAFFDNYVHDSLAGFAKDASLPSDPRVIYLGGNSKSEFAMNENGPAPAVV